MSTTETAAGEISTTSVQTSYLVDIVLCIDCTGSMAPVIEQVKRHALDFSPALDELMRSKGKRIDELRVRVVAFRDVFADDADWLNTTDLIDMRHAPELFRDAVLPLVATGGGSEPESSLEALALAILSDWANASQAKARRVIVMWTDASAHKLEKSAASRSPLLPPGLPGSLDELTEMWNDQPAQSRRLLLYAPDTYPWNLIAAGWSQTIHFPSVAGDGLQEHEFQAILNAIANSV